eukprot:710117-Rhodomonas_salina.1
MTISLGAVLPFMVVVHPGISAALTLAAVTLPLIRQCLYPRHQKSHLFRQRFHLCRQRLLLCQQSSASFNGCGGQVLHSGLAQRILLCRQRFHICRQRLHVRRQTADQVTGCAGAALRAGRAGTGPGR